MTTIDFSNWIANKKHGEQPKANESDRVLAVIQAAGRTGVTRAELGRAIRLERETLDDLLAALFNVGMVTMANKNGVRVFWYMGVTLGPYTANTEWRSMQDQSSEVPNR